MRPSLDVDGCALHAGCNSLVRQACEFDPGADLGLHSFDEQRVEIAALQVCDDEAARLRSRLDATFAVNLWWLLGRGCKYRESGCDKRDGK